jgi:hypothetical protein
VTQHFCQNLKSHTALNYTYFLNKILICQHHPNISELCEICVKMKTQMQNVLLEVSFAKLTFKLLQKEINNSIQFNFIFILGDHTQGHQHNWNSWARKYWQTTCEVLWAKLIMAAI